MSISHILHVFFHLGLCNRCSLRIRILEAPVPGKGVQGFTSHPDLLAHRRNHVPVVVSISIDDVIDAGDISVKFMGSQYGEHLRDLDSRDDRECRSPASVPESFSGSQFHRLELCGMDAGGIAGKHHGTASDKTDQATYDDARKGELAMPALKQIPAAYTYHEYAASNPSTGYGMAELAYSHRVRNDLPER